MTLEWFSTNKKPIINHQIIMMSTWHECYLTGFYSSNHEWIINVLNIEDFQDSSLQMEVDEQDLHSWAYIGDCE